ncbi:MAG TPA: hypothetical protein VMC86_09195 [Gemmatimonadales bacterium]|nr:hypothetical protein [Gemmatimonadales bacterium]
MITDGLTPVGVLLLLGLVGGTLALGIGVVAALLMDQGIWVKRFVLLGAAGYALYAVLLLAHSLTSRTRVLALNQAKHICEMDCHSEYSVIAVRTAKQIAGRTATGEFYVVTVRVQFDSATIGPHRGMGPLEIGPRAVYVVDRSGREYPLEPAGAADSLRRSIVPGASYTTDLVFDLPNGVAGPELFIGAASGAPDWILIGSENSLFHKKTLFALS